jgi:hypothetical protein
MRPYFTVRFVYEARWFKVCTPSAECWPETTPPTFVQGLPGSYQKDRNTFWQYLRQKDASFMSWPGKEGAVAPLEEPVVSSLKRRQGRPVHAWRASSILSQKKARQASWCLKNISSQGVSSSRRIFDSTVLHSGPKAFVEGRWQKTTPEQVAASIHDHGPSHTAAESCFNRKRHGGGPLSDCTPNLSTCDFSLFLEMKMLVKRTKMRGVSRRFELNQRRCWKASWDGVPEMLPELEPALIAVCGDWS